MCQKSSWLFLEYSMDYEGDVQSVGLVSLSMLHVEEHHFSSSAQ